MFGSIFTPENLFLFDPFLGFTIQFVALYCKFNHRYTKLLDRPWAMTDIKIIFFTRAKPKLTLA